jgi:hypothetical protein
MKITGKFYVFSFLIVVLSSLWHSGYGHDPEKIDSLENILYNSLSFNLSQNEKISICISLSELYADTSCEKQVEYAIRALILSEEMSDEENLTRSCKLIS